MPEIPHPSFEEGRKAFRDGHPATSCPYTVSDNPLCRMHWLSGWHQEEYFATPRESAPVEAQPANGSLEEFLKDLRVLVTKHPDFYLRYLNTDDGIWVGRRSDECADLLRLGWEDEWVSNIDDALDKIGGKP